MKSKLRDTNHCQIDWRSEFRVAGPKFRPRRLESNDMSAVYVKNGTPVGSQSVCSTCEYAQIMRGFRASEEVVYCTYANPTFLVPFPVRDCTNHADKNKPSWEDMQKLAIEVRPASSFKPVGFNRSGRDFVTELEDEDEAVNS